MASFNSVTVIGGGAYGTALACAALRAGREVMLYARNAESAAQMKATRKNPKLPGVSLDAVSSITADMVAAAARADIILLATPAQNLREADDDACAAPEACDTGRRLRQGHRARHPSVHDRGHRGNHTGCDIPAILSGPNFADDVARGLPTAVTLAARDERLASDLVQALGSSTFRPYHTTDVRGVEIGGAAKNVLAIAAGIVDGRKLGASALAALTTRGFSELARLGRACGARSETLAGLSGLGDLILSCSSLQSRNFAFGIALGRGEAPNRDKLAEGEFTAPVLIELAASQNVDMPVSTAVAAILSGKVTIDAAIEGLLTRPFKAEE